MARKNQRLINYHTGTENMPLSSNVELGEIVVRHKDNQPELLIKKDNGDFATFIDSNAVEKKITTLKTTLEGQVDAVAGDVTELSGGVATELAKYDTRDVAEGKITTAKDAAIGAASAYTDAEITRLSDVYDVKGAAASALTDAKAYANGLAVNYDAAGAAASALTDAKAYANSLNNDMDKRVDALEAISGESHTHSNKDVLDGISSENIINWNDAVSKEHVHNNKDVLDGITSAKVIAWDAAEANASAYTDTEIAKLSGVYAAKSVVNTLVGTDTGKSVRTIANEELVKQLIPEDAQESLDTLQEIAAWIQNHPESVSEINANIASLSAATGTLHTNIENVAGDVTELSNAVDTKFNDYYTSAQTDTKIATAKNEAIAAASAYTDAQVASAKSILDKAVKDVDDKVDALSGSVTAFSATVVNNYATKEVASGYAETAKSEAIGAASAYTDSQINALDTRIESLTATTNSAVQTITVDNTETNKITATKTGTSVAFNFDNMVIDCGDF